MGRCRAGGEVSNAPLIPALFLRPHTQPEARWFAEVAGAGNLPGEHIRAPTQQELEEHA